MSHPTVYRFFNESGDLLYIGSTFVPHLRWTQHKQRDWFAEVATVTVEHFTDTDAMKRAEVVAIRSEQPRYNIACRDERPPAPRSSVPARSGEEWAARTARHEADLAACDGVADTAACRARLLEDVAALERELREAVHEDIAAGKPVTQIAKDAGLSRERIYQIRDGRR